MRMREFEKLHSLNRKQVQKAITQLNRSLNIALSSGKDDLAYANVRCLFILWVSWLECSLNTILHSANKLSYSDRRKIINRQAECDRWTRLIEISFRNYYLKGRKRILNKLNLGPTAFYRYNELNSILNDHIATFIEIRNRLAHGQWYVAFNNESTSKNDNITRHLWTLSKKDIMLVKSIIRSFVLLIHDLVTSKKHFEGRFDVLVSRIVEAREFSQKRFDGTMYHLKRSYAKKISLGYY